MKAMGLDLKWKIEIDWVGKIEIEGIILHNISESILHSISLQVFMCNGELHIEIVSAYFYFYSKSKFYKVS